MEDSIDIDSLERAEILAKLDLGQSSPLGTEKLRNMLKCVLKRNHSIHVYLSQLSQECLKKLYLIIFQKPVNHRQYDKIKKALSNEMFKKFPKAPLNTLTWIKNTEKIPTEIDFDIILKTISEKLTCTESSKSEVPPEGELNTSNKKEQKRGLKNANCGST